MTDKLVEKIDFAKPLPGAVASRVAQFRTKRQAEAAARQIGWSALDATRVTVLGFYVWVIADPHGNAVTNDALAAWGGR